MGVDDLRARQEARLSQAKAWEELGQELRNQLQVALPSVAAEVVSRTGLEISTNDWTLDWKFQENCLVFRGQELLEFHLLHIKEDDVSVYVQHSELSRQADGSWLVVVSRGWAIESRTLAPKPWLALVINRGGEPKHYMAWHGPEDKEKLISALIDAFSGRETPRALTFREPESDAHRLSFPTPESRPVPEPVEKTIGGYKVRVRYEKLDPAEEARRSKALAEVVAKSIRRQIRDSS